MPSDFWLSVFCLYDFNWDTNLLVRRILSLLCLFLSGNRQSFPLNYHKEELYVDLNQHRRSTGTTKQQSHKKEKMRKYVEDIESEKENNEGKLFFIHKTLY